MTDRINLSAEEMELAVRYLNSQPGCAALPKGAVPRLIREINERREDREREIQRAKAGKLPEQARVQALRLAVDAYGNHAGLNAKNVTAAAEDFLQFLTGTSGVSE